MTFFKCENIPDSTWKKMNQESQIKYTASRLVVLYLDPLLHRVHSVPVWLVLVMR